MAEKDFEKEYSPDTPMKIKMTNGKNFYVASSVRALLSPKKCTNANLMNGLRD